MTILVRAWNRFWFEPQPTSTLAVFRIVFGLLVFAWGVALLPDLDAFFSSDGIEPRRPTDLGLGLWGVLNVVDTDGAVVALYVALLLASLCLCVGYRTRLASVVVFVAVISFEHRTESVFNAGDGLIRVMAFFLMFAPAGASLSVDRRRRYRDRFWEFPARAPWALRLIQIQVSVMYLASVWEKLQGETWLDGTAVSLALGLEDLQRFPPPDSVVHSLLFSSVLTYWTLAVELMVGVLVWNRAARPFVLALGAIMHLAIGVTLRITFFSEAVLTAYLVFLSPAAAVTVVLFVRDRLSGLARRPRVHAATGR